jgi:hypothetical protein
MTMMRAWRGQPAAATAAVLLGGCASLPSSPPQLAAGDVEVTLERFTQVSLEPMPPAPVVQLVNLRQGLTGSSGSRSLVVLVFDDRAATTQILGNRRAGRRSGTVHRHRNVVVIARGNGAFQRRVVSALRTVARRPD